MFLKKIRAKKPEATYIFTATCLIQDTCHSFYIVWGSLVFCCLQCLLQTYSFPNLPSFTTETYILLNIPWDIQVLKHFSLPYKIQISLRILYFYLLSLSPLPLLLLESQFPCLYFIEKNVDILWTCPHLPVSTLSGSPHLVSSSFLCLWKKKKIFYGQRTIPWTWNPIPLFLCWPLIH